MWHPFPHPDARTPRRCRLFNLLSNRFHARLCRMSYPAIAIQIRIVQSLFTNPRTTTGPFVNHARDHAPIDPHEKTGTWKGEWDSGSATSAHSVGYGGSISVWRDGTTGVHTIGRNTRFSVEPLIMSPGKFLPNKPMIYAPQSACINSLCILKQLVSLISLSKLSTAWTVSNPKPPPPRKPYVLCPAVA